jgi:hypothetical protein
VRYVDSSLERIEVRVTGLNEQPHVVTVNGQALPLQPTGVAGEFVCGVRYKAWNPPSALHPSIGVHAPLTFDIVDTWMQRSHRRLPVPRGPPGRAQLRRLSRSTPTRPRAAAWRASSAWATPRALMKVPPATIQRGGQPRVPVHAGSAARDVAEKAQQNDLPRIIFFRPLASVQRSLERYGFRSYSDIETRSDSSTDVRVPIGRSVRVSPGAHRMRQSVDCGSTLPRSHRDRRARKTCRQPGLAASHGAAMRRTPATLTSCADGAERDAIKSVAQVRRPLAVRQLDRIFQRILARGFADLNRRTDTLQRQIRDNGVTYNVYADAGGPAAPLGAGPVPADRHARELAGRSRPACCSASGCSNRSWPMSMARSELLKRALLPPALVQGHPGYLRAMRNVEPVGGTRLHIAAFDLARGPDGNWWVVSQRTQAPSGLGYLLENRLSISRLFPKAFEHMRVQRLAATYRALVDNLKA